MWLSKHWCLAPPLMLVVQIKCICMPSTATCTGIGQYWSPSGTVGHKACPFYSGCCGLFKGYILLHLKQWSVAWTCPWAGSDHQSKTAETSRRPELQQMETYTLEGSSSTPSSIMQLCDGTHECLISNMAPLLIHCYQQWWQESGITVVLERAHDCVQYNSGTGEGTWLRAIQQWYWRGHMIACNTTVVLERAHDCMQCNSGTG